MVDKFAGAAKTENTSDALDAVLMALADPTRRAILKQLSRRESTVNEIAKPYDISLAGVSKHIQVLEKARLVLKRKEGRVQHCRLNPQPLGAVARQLIEYKHFWENQFDALERFLHETEANASNNSDNSDESDKPNHGTL
jgi:DNA-binding transcriptional ArsR family regulator